MQQINPKTMTEVSAASTGKIWQSQPPTQTCLEPELLLLSSILLLTNVARASALQPGEDSAESDLHRGNVKELTPGPHPLCQELNQQAAASPPLQPGQQSEWQKGPFTDTGTSVSATKPGFQQVSLELLF